MTVKIASDIAHGSLWLHLSLSLICRIVWVTHAGMKYLHAEEIIHWELQPKNILVLGIPPAFPVSFSFSLCLNLSLWLCGLNRRRRSTPPRQRPIFTSRSRTGTSPRTRSPPSAPPSSRRFVPESRCAIATCMYVALLRQRADGNPSSPRGFLCTRLRRS
jgi:hypothetical protein